MIDIGSFEVSEKIGGVRKVLPVTVGVDMREGPGVDLVMPGEKLLEHFGPASFDVVISCDTLEHVANWRGFLNSLWGILKPGGLCILSIASRSKGRHAYPDDYWRLTKGIVFDIFGENVQEDRYIENQISTVWVCTKKTDLPDLSKIQLIPVDKKVPKELI